MGDSATAEDFVAEALKRMVHGKRKYEPKVDLFLNLKSIIRSLINAHKKSSDRTPLVDRGAASSDEEEFDPTLLISDLDAAPAHEVLDGKERRAAAKDWREALKESLKDKPELLALEDAMFNEYSDCAEIATLCDCTVDRVYVLNRALKKHTIAFFGVQTTAELARKTMGTP
jgi:DNA-directed RNA polymerase specialized sigma24 family protein